MYGEPSGLSRKRRRLAADGPAASAPRTGCYPRLPMSMDPSLQAKKEAAMAPLRAAGRVAVALSGGVDSAVLLALAVEALGPDNVLALTGRSPAVPEGEIDDARQVAEALRVLHRVVETYELDRPGYRANAGDRCYHCRSELFDVLEQLVVVGGDYALAYGAIADDLGEDRPGMRAAAERGVLAPLLEADLSKVEVRRLAEAAGLSVRDKPASACLASRLPVGTEVTPERLLAVERAEEGLRHLGLRQVRVRHHGDLARIETDAEGLRELAAPAAREAAVAAVRAAGFRFVTLDLEGYRPGGVARPSPLLRIAPPAEGGQ
jgi:uncharacterized protein